MSSVKSAVAIKLALLGAACFWLPDTIVHAVHRFSFDHKDVIFITVTMPVSLAAAWLISARRFAISARQAALPMLVGVWLLGGFFMTVGASFSGGGFAAGANVLSTVGAIALTLVPPYTAIFATYDGSLGALLLVSLVLFLASLRPFDKASVAP